MQVKQAKLKISQLNKEVEYEQFHFETIQEALDTPKVGGSTEKLLKFFSRGFDLAVRGELRQKELAGVVNPDKVFEATAKKLAPVWKCTLEEAIERLKAS